MSLLFLSFVAVTHMWEVLLQANNSVSWPAQFRFSSNLLQSAQILDFDSTVNGGHYLPSDEE